MDRALFPFWNKATRGKAEECQDTEATASKGQETEYIWRVSWPPSVCAYSSELIGRCSVVQQQVDDVCVSLLRSLVERCVAVLQVRKESGYSAPTGLCCTL